MAEFAPFGLMPVDTISNATAFTDGIMRYPYEPSAYGFQGDLVSPYVTPALPATAPFNIPVFTRKYVVPTNLTNTAVPTDKNLVSTVLGVAMGFEYQPLVLQGQLQKSTQWIPGTQLMPNTGVTVLVTINPSQEFKIQYQGLLDPKMMYTGVVVDSLDTYTKAGTDSFDYTFPKGDTTIPFGTSKIFARQIVPNSQQTIKYRTIQAFTPLFITGVIDDSGFTTTNPTQIFNNPTIRVKVSYPYSTLGTYVQVKP